MKENTPTLMQSEEERAPWNEAPVEPRTVHVDVEYVIQRKGVSVPVCGDDDDLMECHDDEHYTIEDLLDILKGYVKADLEKHTCSKRKEEFLNRILSDCEGWEIYDKSCCLSE
jgi:hypothetical protein